MHHLPRVADCLLPSTAPMDITDNFPLLRQVSPERVTINKFLVLVGCFLRHLSTTSVLSSFLSCQTVMAGYIVTVRRELHQSATVYHSTRPLNHISHHSQIKVGITDTLPVKDITVGTRVRATSTGARSKGCTKFSIYASVREFWDS